MNTSVGQTEAILTPLTMELKMWFVERTRSSSNQIRPTSLVYPNSRTLTLDYGTSGGMNDQLNRLGGIKDGTVTLAGYTYLGQGTVIQINYSQPGVMLDLWGGTSGTFTGIDQFNRIIDQRWVTTSGTPTDLDRYKYGYDRNSNRFYRQNTVGSGLDEFYTYDNLNRLTMMQRGTDDFLTPDQVQQWRNNCPGPSHVMLRSCNQGMGPNRKSWEDAWGVSPSQLQVPDYYEKWWYLSDPPAGK